MAGFWRNEGGDLGVGGSTAAFATTPGVIQGSPSGGGVWQGGGGLPAGLDGNGTNAIYASTADGAYDGATNNDWGDSFLKLSTTNLQLLNTFTPADWFWRWDHSCNGGNGNDVDLGSAGTMLVPDDILQDSHYKRIAIKGDKESYIWVLDRTNPGGTGTGCSQNCNACTGTNSGVDQQLPITGVDAKTTPAFWFDGTTPFMYVGQDKTKISQYRLNCAFPNGPICTPAASTTSMQMGYTPNVSISSNGTTSGTGIAWVIKSRDTSSNDTGLGLYAFDAENLANTLYQPSICPNRDAIGLPTKFSVPTVANGYVFVGTTTDFDIFGTGAGGCH